MTNTVSYIPEGLRSITPYFHVQDGAGAIEFYKKAFGATELMRYADPNGKVIHAKILIGDSTIEVGEAAEIAAYGPGSLPPVSIHLYVEDANTVFDQAIAAGAISLNPITDQPYGDREGGVKDPFGISWWIATHTGNVST